MECPRCHAKNIEGARFCEECGARLEVACPQCGHPITSGKKFCRSCGAAVGSQPSRLPSPDTYTPKHLADRILISRNALEGERKQVTVLFADLKGSLELLADRDPEDARKLLDPIVEHMMEAVHCYEGTVNQVMGDGIMALFGAPLAHEDHAARACYAALRLQESVRRYAEGVRRQEGVLLQVRVGLNSGEVVVCSIGSDLHMDYTAVGQTTHLAARMEQLAAPGSILLTADTLTLAEGHVQVKPLGPMTVKGLDAPVEAYELTGVGAARSRFQAMRIRGLSRFVGREVEVEQLHRVLALAGEGRGQVVSIVGEPGVGKSRLVFELLHSHRVAGWLTLESGSVSYGKATSYLPVIDLLKSYFKIGDRDSHRDIREKVTGKLLTLDRALEPTLPALLALLDVPAEDPTWQALDPAQRRQRTLEAVKRLVLREAQVQPLLLVFEDLHWIDSETQALLDGLIEGLPTARLLLVVNYRPEYRHGWGGKTYYTQLRLDTLPPESAGVLLDALLGSDPGLERLRSLLATQTGGNPLFLEESLRILVETHVLRGERGAYRLAQPVEKVQIPSTVHAILASRIDRLPPDEKRLLQTAAVIGKDFPFALLQGIADEAEEALRRDLSHLQSAEFLYETNLFPDLEYTFKHALTHEVAFGSVTQARRQALHAKIVDAIETLYADRLGEHTEQLAYHAFRGQVWERAVEYLRAAGRKAASRVAHREAVACFEHALEALGHLPQTSDAVVQAIDLRLDLRASMVPLAEFQRAFQHLREAEASCQLVDDRGRLAQVYRFMSFHNFGTGTLRDARPFAQRALALADAIGQLGPRVSANLEVGCVEVLSGSYLVADRYLRTAVELMGMDLRQQLHSTGFPAVLARSWLAWACAERGEFQDGIAWGREAVRIGEELAQPYSSVLARWRLSYLHIVQGNFAEAVPLLEAARDLIQEWHLLPNAPLVNWALGHAYGHVGQNSQGLTLLERAMIEHEATGFRAWQSRAAVCLGEAYLRAQREQDALAVGTRALALAQERGERGHEAYALCLLGEVATGPELFDFETARTHYHQGLSLATDLAMRPLAAHCHLGLGTLYRRTSQRAKAKEHLSTAGNMYREMEMGVWLEQAEATLESPHGESR